MNNRVLARRWYGDGEKKKNGEDRDDCWDAI